MKTLAEQFREHLKRFPEATESDVGELLRITRNIEITTNDQAVQVFREISRLRQSLSSWKLRTIVFAALWVGTVVGWWFRGWS